ncbi:MAG TPA: hypothetical protein VL242_13040, partial [Sorangium sp.]|nr:hypothetical protein [Sorangium sp.]
MGTEDRERGSLSGSSRGAERADAATRSAIRPSRPRRDRPPVEQRPLVPSRGEKASPWTKLLFALRPPRKLKFTREGKYYLGITLGVGFAA